MEDIQATKKNGGHPGDAWHTQTNNNGGTQATQVTLKRRRIMGVTKTTQGH